MKVALYQPDIAGNVGTIIRTCACIGMDLDIIEPCGFPFDENKIRRSAMDYYNHVKINRFNSFLEFKNYNNSSRIILLTTNASTPHYEFKFRNSDILLAGQESAGTPDEIHNLVDERIIIPMKNGMRCLNVAISLAMVIDWAIGSVNKKTNI